MNGLPVVFRALRTAFEEADVPFAVGGSWASTAYGEPRQTNDIDLIAALDPARLDRFLNALDTGFYFDRETANTALRLGRPFNVIHIGLAYKFDVFPANDDHARKEIERRCFIPIPGLDEEPVPVVTAEDAVIAKLRWYRQGGEVSAQQWRDVLGILRAEGSRLDGAYLDSWAARLGLTDLLQRARSE